MKTTENKPMHTQGEWLVDNVGKNIIIIYNNYGRKTPQVRNEMAVIPSILIGGNYHISREEAEANAQRIVKCVNMHDELVEALRELLSVSNDFNTGDKGDQVQKMAEKLIKQAEQK